MGVDAELERLRELYEAAGRWPAWPEVVARCAARQPVTIDRTIGASRALIAVHVARPSDRPIWIVCPEQDDIESWIDDLTLFGVDAALPLPAAEASRAAAPHDPSVAQRRQTLGRLLDGPTPPVVVASAAAVRQAAPCPDTLRAKRLRLRVGQALPMERMVEWLRGEQFVSVPAIEQRGEFAQRGGIIDFFPAEAEAPWRVEWFGDEIDSIRSFDVASQRSRQRVESLQLDPWNLPPDQQIPLAAYLPPQAVILADDWQAIRNVWERSERHDDDREATTQVARWLGTRPLIDLVPFARPGEGSFSFPVTTVDRVQQGIGEIADEFDVIVGDDRVVLCAETEAERDRIGELLTDTDVSRSGRLSTLVGHPSGGFRFAQDGVVLLSTVELFQRRTIRRRPRDLAGRPVADFTEFEPGELVVHLAHGIGRYRGLERVAKEGRAEDHLVVEFAGGTRVYVPASQIDLVQKYVGGSKRTPRLAKVGGRAWARTKAQAAEAVEDLAAEMLQLQAARMSSPGIAFAPDSPWQRNFDAAFPYVETDDQLAAIEAIKADMQAARPMDRLLCGDVGFGKTEVAMRAAFKAVESGYQVAVLVPTTILAEQHYQTFRDRMSEYPIRVARLSRFCSPSETRDILKELEQGAVDIVIGTHRLASRDVRFGNLGLVIIDEEQRFGVAVKERLKALRASVDILTMTATPIPRTLHMALVGVRDISNLQSAPQDRMAVETRVMSFEPEPIREAIVRELDRGGQIFFVHNRIEDIEAVAGELRRLVPDLRLRVAHARLPESELEQVMVDFVYHRFDLLLSTTIVESGLDIPNANTIFIDDAQNYGLADLHQLRGRVGRYKHRAYCYLLVDPDRPLTPNAARRLRAIEEFSELGAGFDLAMRDLEIRGAGNLLGTQQSGHIAAVGYQHYCELLESAVRRMKRLPVAAELRVDLRLPGEAYLGDEYVGGLRGKMEMYGRLRKLRSLEEADDLEAEWRDRFGPLPPPAIRLLEQARIRILAAAWQLEAIWTEQEGRYLGMRYADRTAAERLLATRPQELRFVGRDAVFATVPPSATAPDALLDWLKSMLQATPAGRYNPAAS